MKITMIKQKNTFKNRGRRNKRAFLLFIIYITSFLNLVPVSASPPTTFYNSLIKIHENGTSTPKWTYEQFKAKINKIADDTLSQPYNSDGDWINPYVYDEYSQMVTYGLPHGKTDEYGTTTADFYVCGGSMFNLTNGVQGEYRHLGYNEKGGSVTNDRWHNASYTGTGQFSSKSDYTEIQYSSIGGAFRSWDSLDNNIKGYILDAKFYDDDYRDTDGKVKTPYSLKDLWSNDYIYNNFLLQSIPGIARSGSIKMAYSTFHNTVTVDPIPFIFTSKMEIADGNTYTLKNGENEITITINITVNFADSKNNMYLKDVEVSCFDNNPSLSVTPGNTEYKFSLQKTYDRSMLETGKNEENIDANIKINSNYKDYKTDTLSESITINVEESPEPWVEAVMTATPNIVQYTGQDIPVTLDIAYGIANLKNTNLIDDIYIMVEDEATITKPATLVGEHRLNVKIPKTFLGNENQKDKIYKAHIQYNLSNGDNYKVTKTAVVRVYKTQLEPDPTPGPTPTPIPISDNQPPSVRLTAPSEVKAGEEFWVRASASDPDGDPLRYIWHVDNSSGNKMPEGTKSGKIWYDIKYANTVQEVQVIVIDTKGDGADDVQVINVLPPTIDARMQIDGALKVNRKITLKDLSKTPDHYPITSRTWTVTPITSGITASDIKRTGNLNSTSEDLLFKKPGEYKIKLTLKNSAGYSETVERIITISPDEKPVAQFKTTDLIYRDPDDGSQASIKLADSSYSFDNDTISQRIWKYRYDSDNDGSFSDETWVTLNSSNLSEYTYKTKNVGRYEFSLTVKESFGQSTISTFISPSEYLTGTITQIVEVVNNAPLISLKLESKEKVDIVIAIGNTLHSKSEINEKIDSILKPMLFNKGADAKITVIEGNQKTGNYYYDIYNGFTAWSSEPEVIDRGVSNWTYQYNYRNQPPLTDAWGYTEPYDTSTSGYGKWDFYSASITGEYTYYKDPNLDEYIYEYSYIEQQTTILEKYEIVDSRDDSSDKGPNWRNKYHETDYYRYRDPADYKIRNKFIETLCYKDGILPNNGRIMKILSKDRKYIGHWAIKRNPEVISNLDIVFSKTPTYREDSTRYLVYVMDDSFTVSSTHKNKLENNKAKIIGFGTNDNKSSFEGLNTGVYGSLFINNTNLNTAFETLANSLSTEIPPSTITKYVLKDEVVNISAHYSDYENDPQYSQVEYSYTHDPNYFENGEGLSANAGKSLTSPTLVFDKTGKYDISVRTRDNPKNDSKFNDYRLWSNSQNMTIIVHNAPIAQFEHQGTYNKSTKRDYDLKFTNTSYDKDHISLSNKGIIKENWSYKLSSSKDWIEGLPSSITRGSNIYVKLEVMDMEYAWSSVIKKISYNELETSPNVVAKFMFTKNPLYLDELGTKTRLNNWIKDLSYTKGERMSQTRIDDREWTVKKDGEILIKDSSSTNINLKTYGAGVYEVTLVVCSEYDYYSDSGRRYTGWQWSDPYTDTLIVLERDAVPPTLTLTPPNRSWSKANASVSIKAADAGGSGLKEVRYLWTENPEFADGAFTTVATTTGNISLTQSNEGSWYLYAQAVDKAGNASFIVKGGPYQVDKTAPTLSEFRVTGESYRSGSTYWVRGGNNIDVHIKSKDIHSGARYTYLRIPQGKDNRANHDFNGSATNLNEWMESSYTDIIAAERTLVNNADGLYEVRFTIKGLADIVSDLQYYFTDKASNSRGYINSGCKIGVDTKAPDINITPNARDLGKTEITASVSVSDVGSGIKESKYIVTDSTEKPAANAEWTRALGNHFNVDVTGTGTWYLHVETSDNVGNTAYKRTDALKVDVDAPVVAVTPIKRLWDNADVDISIVATEGYSSLKEVRYSITNNTDIVYSGWQNVSASGSNSLTIKDDGSWYLHVEAEDIVGNISYTYFGPYQVDRQKPVLTMGYVGGARHISGKNYYARQGDTVTFWMQGKDALSGMWRLLAIARDGTTNPYRAAVYNNTFPSYGTHTRVKVDTPTITVNNGNTLKANIPYNILTSGDYTFEIEGIADDLATYNRHGWVDTGLRLISDNTPPTVTVDKQSGQCITRAQINISSSDAGSGVKNISYVWSSTTTTPSTGWTTVNSNKATAVNEPEGIWYLHIKSTDNVGNVSTVKTFGPYEVIHLNASNFRVTQIYDIAWRGYYFNLNAGTDTNGDGKADRYPKYTNTDILTSQMPINKDGRVSYSESGMKAGYKFEGAITVIGEPDNVSFNIHYKENGTTKTNTVSCTKGAGEEYLFEWIVPLETDANSYIEVDFIATKGDETYGNEVWFDTWHTSNTTRKIMYIVNGNSVDDLTFIQSK